MSKVSARGQAWQAQRQRVLARDGYCCQYCGKRDLQGRDATVDHVEPISLDPTKVYRDDELVTACLRCNGRKQDKELVRTDYLSADWQ